MITISQLESILAVARERHFGKAALSCHVSQPSLSLQIQKAEAFLGYLIFDRSARRNVQLTERGAVFVDHARDVVRAHRKLMDIGQQQGSSVRGQFRLAVIPTVLPSLVPAFLSPFSEHYPDVELTILSHTTEEIVELLRDEAIDAGILASPLGEAQLRERVLYYESFLVYAHQNHPLLHKAQLSPSDLKSDDIWLLEDGHCLRNQIISFCSLPSSTRIYPNIHFEGGSLDTLRQVILKNGGYTLIPKLFGEQLPKKEQAWIRPFQAPAPMREIALVFNRHQWKKDILKALQISIQNNITSCIPESGRLIPVYRD